MTTTFSNQEQENLSQLIFNSIDEIGRKMEETPDLALDVLPFIRKQSEKPLPSGRGYSYIEL